MKVLVVFVFVVFVVMDVVKIIFCCSSVGKGLIIFRLGVVSMLRRNILSLVLFVVIVLMICVGVVCILVLVFIILLMLSWLNICKIWVPVVFVGMVVMDCVLSRVCFSVLGVLMFGLGVFE